MWKPGAGREGRELSLRTHPRSPQNPSPMRSGGGDRCRHVDCVAIVRPVSFTHVPVLLPQPSGTLYRFPCTGGMGERRKDGEGGRVEGKTNGKLAAAREPPWSSVRRIRKHDVHATAP